MKHERDAASLAEEHGIHDLSAEGATAGVVSGAGSFRPAIVLDRQTSHKQRVPVALLGKVYCRVDASNGAIAAGDLLTTSSTAGHAMRLSDPLRGFGASIGKALRGHSEGSGLIPVLIALR